MILDQWEFLTGWGLLFITMHCNGYNFYEDFGNGNIYKIFSLRIWMFFNCISSDRKTLLALQIHIIQILFNEKAKIWRKTRKIFTIRDFDSTYHLSFVIHVQNIVGVSNLAAQLWNKLFICYIKRWVLNQDRAPGNNKRNLITALKVHWKNIVQIGNCFSEFLLKMFFWLEFPSIIFGESCSVSLAFGFLSLCT